MERKRDEKKHRKQEEQKEASPDVSDNEDDALDYSSNEEELLEKKQSLQRAEPRLPKTFEEKQSMPRVIVVLEHANLETANTKRGIELLNCDDHQRLIQKMKRTLEEFRPDVLHQCLLSLLDSPLNKAGLLQVYVKTAKNVLIEINPQTRIPRTFKRFSGLMAQLLTNMKIRAAGSSVTLMRVIKNPVTAHLPIGVKKVGTSTKGKLVHLPTYVKEVMGGEGTKKPIVFSIGAVSIGNPAMENDYVDESICISNYSLSAACVCSKLCDAFEDLWKVL